jgi:hypothetical protein
LYIASHGFVHPGEFPDIIINTDFQKIVLAVRNAPQNAIQKGPAPFVPMQGYTFS